MHSGVTGKHARKMWQRPTLYLARELLICFTICWKGDTEGRRCMQQSHKAMHREAVWLLSSKLQCMHGNRRGCGSVTVTTHLICDEMATSLESW